MILDYSLNTHDFCITQRVKWVVNIFQFQAMKLKLLSIREGLCERERDKIREKEIGILFCLNLLKIVLVNEGHFQGFLWDSFAIKNLYSLACRSSLCSRLFRTSSFQITRKKTSNCRRSLKNMNHWRRQKLIKNVKLLANFLWVFP